MKFLTSGQLQAILHISRPTLYLWVRQGKLSPKRAGRALLFEESDILALLRPQGAALVKQKADASAEAADRRIEKILSLRFDSGEKDVAARHEEHQP